MDKWKNNRGKVVGIGEDSILPPTRRISNVTPPPLLDKRRSKKWSIDGIFKSVFSKIDAQSSSSSFEDLSKRHRRKTKGKSKGAPRLPGYAPKSRAPGTNYSSAPLSSLSSLYNNNHIVNGNGNGNGHGNGHVGVDQPTESGILNLHSRSSDGSMEGSGRRARKDKVKARVEAKRDRLCASDSSIDESSEDETSRKRHEHKKRSSRASRTERYLKRMCNGGSTVPGRHAPADSRSIESHEPWNGHFQPIDRVPRSDYPGQGMTILGANKAEIQPVPRFDNGLPNGNVYGQPEKSGVNVLIQQTLQYFNDFERNLLTTQNKERKSFPSQNRLRNLRSPAQMDELPRFVVDPHTRRTSLTPPKPPSRDYRSRLFVNSTPIDKNMQILKYMSRASDQTPEKENGFFGSPKSSLVSPNTQVRNISEGQSSNISPTTRVCTYEIPPTSPPISPLKELPNMALLGGGGTLIDENGSPELNLKKSKNLDQQSRFSTVLQSKNYENSNYPPFKKTENEKPNNRRSLKTLEEAMCELETIYNSLQLADEELLDRAEQRTMEEFRYKRFATSPDNFDNEDSTSRRKTWEDPTLSNFKDEPEIPDRLKDDMAYRRMHPKERPSSVDGPSSLCSISYLMTSPIPSRREAHYFDSKKKSRRKEPDVTLDDVVFRSMQYANNTLKVVEPQPPFGIPLGPITTATDSDYLHTRPTRLERARFPYIPSCEPNIVTDDLAFRNLRKDAQPSQQNGSSNTSPTSSFGVRKHRAVRSLSANLYGLINSSPATSTLGLDNEDQSSFIGGSSIDRFLSDVSLKRISRRTSDPEVMSIDWQSCAPNCLDVSRNGNAEQPEHKDVLSDVDTSNRSWDESSDERIRAHERLVLEDTKVDYKINSDKCSSYISSNCSTPSLSPQLEIEPITEQEVSVYKKLCQDLENLVQLTKGIDAIPAPSDSQEVRVSKEEVTMPKAQKSPGRTWLTKGKAGKFNVGEMIDSIGKDSSTKIEDGAPEPSPIKREISTILDSLKKLGEDSICSNSSCVDRVKPKEEVVLEEKSFNVMTKEICDPAAERSEVEAQPRKHRTADVNDRQAEEEEEEEEERKDCVDENVFFRRVQLAKLSGDWKESTPNGGGALVNRRTSLSGEANWEGMNKCNHKYNSMPAKTSSLFPFRNYGSKRKSNKRKSMCSVS